MMLGLKGFRTIRLVSKSLWVRIPLGDKIFSLSHAHEMLTVTSFLFHVLINLKFTYNHYQAKKRCFTQK